MTRDDMRGALLHPNVQAFLRVIREGESGQTDDAYRTMYGGGKFTSFEDHPRKANTAAGITSTAAGAYQFLEKTWDGLVAKYGFPDFSPECQDEAAVALIAGRGALQDLLRGDISEVLEKCSWEWASLPPGRYGQPTLDAKRVYATYDKWLNPTSTPVKEETMPFPLGMIAAAADALLPLVVDLFRGHGSKTAVRNADIIEKAGPTLVEVAKEVSGQQGMAEAVTAVLDSPEKSAEFRAAVEKDLDKLVGMIERVTKIEDDSRDRATARASKDSVDIAPRLAREQFFIVVGAGVFIAAIAGIDMWKDGSMSEGILAIVAGYVGWAMQKRGTIVDYRFGSSAGSAAKDEIIAQAKRS